MLIYTRSEPGAEFPIRYNSGSFLDIKNSFELIRNVESDNIIGTSISLAPSFTSLQDNIDAFKSFIFKGTGINVDIDCELEYRRTFDAFLIIFKGLDNSNHTYDGVNEFEYLRTNPVSKLLYNYYKVFYFCAYKRSLHPETREFTRYIHFIANLNNIIRNNTTEYINSNFETSLLYLKPLFIDTSLLSNISYKFTINFELLSYPTDLSTKLEFYKSLITHPMLLLYDIDIDNSTVCSYAIDTMFELTVEFPKINFYDNLSRLINQRISNKHMIYLHKITECINTYRFNNYDVLASIFADLTKLSFI